MFAQPVGDRFRLTFAQAVTAKAHSASDGDGILWTDVTIFCDGRQPAYAKQLICRGRDAAFGGYLHDKSVFAIVSHRVAL